MSNGGSLLDRRIRVAALAVLIVLCSCGRVQRHEVTAGVLLGPQAAPLAGVRVALYEGHTAEVATVGVRILGSDGHTLFADHATLRQRDRNFVMWDPRSPRLWIYSGDKGTFAVDPDDPSDAVAGGWHRSAETVSTDAPLRLRQAIGR